MAERILKYFAHSQLPIDSYAKGTHVLLSKSTDVDTAVIFIHGFSGDPVDTWSHFGEVMEEADHQGWWERVDGYFFTYSDVQSSIDDSADDLSAFVEGVFPSPEPTLQELIALSGRHVRSYSKLVFVAHSEGAIVLRSYIAELGKMMDRDGGKSPVLDAKLMLFAPAIFGFTPTGLLGVLAQVSGIREVINLCIAYSPSATEMREVVTLNQVQRDTEKLHDRYPEISAFKAHVVFGRKESVVAKSRYFQDVKYPSIASKDHVTVCKPDMSYQWPLDFVAGRKR